MGYGGRGEGGWAPKRGIGLGNWWNNRGRVVWRRYSVIMQVLIDTRAINCGITKASLTFEGSVIKNLNGGKPVAT